MLTMTNMLVGCTSEGYGGGSLAAAALGHWASISERRLARLGVGRRGLEFPGL